MSELLVSIILAICPAPEAVETTPCMERIVNCAVTKNGTITAESIQKCVDERSGE